MLPMSVISTDSEGAKRPKGSGEIPRMRPLPCRYEVFSPRSACYALPDARWISLQVLGLHSFQPIGYALRRNNRLLYAAHPSAQIRLDRRLHQEIPVKSPGVLRSH